MDLISNLAIMADNVSVKSQKVNFQFSNNDVSLSILRTRKVLPLPRRVPLTQVRKLNQSLKNATRRTHLRLLMEIQNQKVKKKRLQLK